MFANNNDKIARLLEGCAEAQRTTDGRTFYRDDINTFVSLSGCGIDYSRNIPNGASISKLTRIALNTFIMFNGGALINEITWQPTANEAGAINNMKYDFEGEFQGIKSTVINKIWQIVPTNEALMGLPVVGPAPLTTVYQGSKTNSLDICSDIGANAPLIVKNNVSGRLKVRRHEWVFRTGAAANYVALGDQSYIVVATPDISVNLTVSTDGVVRPLVQNVWYTFNGNFSINSIVPFVGAINLEYELFSCRNIEGNAAVYRLAENPMITRDIVAIIDRVRNVEGVKRQMIERFCGAFGILFNDVERLARIGSIDDSNLLARIITAFLDIDLELA